MKNVDNKSGKVFSKALYTVLWSVILILVCFICISAEKQYFSFLQESNDAAKELYVGLMFGFVIPLILICLFVVFAKERNQSNINLCASKTRKLLLAAVKAPEKISEALSLICSAAGADGIFFVDLQNDKFSFFNSGKNENIADKVTFMTEIMKHIEYKKGISISSVKANKRLYKHRNELYRLMKAHNVKRMAYAVIANEYGSNGVLCAVNSKRYIGVKKLLKDIIVCFSMAIYNQKYIEETEMSAITDSLTGLVNRMGYKKDIANLNSKKSIGLGCVYVDVNELHIFNNKYGHFAGDAMLLFVADTIKEVFEGCRIYRMGGDEFLVFTEDLSEQEIIEKIELADGMAKEKNYHVSVGYCCNDGSMEPEMLVRNAEKMMYDAKAKYYQDKDAANSSETDERNMNYMSTQIREIDACLSVLTMKYLGIYCVSLNEDKATNIVMTAYFEEMLSQSGKFTEGLLKYVQNIVQSDDRRPLLNFLDYNIIKEQLKNGHRPRITYTKLNGKKVTLSIYALPNQKEISETLWFFEVAHDAE